MLEGCDYELRLWQKKLQVQILTLLLLSHENLGRVVEHFWVQFRFLLNEGHHIYVKLYVD